MTTDIPPIQLASSSENIASEKPVIPDLTKTVDEQMQNSEIVGILNSYLTFIRFSISQAEKIINKTKQGILTRSGEDALINDISEISTKLINNDIPSFGTFKDSLLDYLQTTSKTTSELNTQEISKIKLRITTINRAIEKIKISIPKLKETAKLYIELIDKMKDANYLTQIINGEISTLEFPAKIRKHIIAASTISSPNIADELKEIDQQLKQTEDLSKKQKMLDDKISGIRKQIESKNEQLSKATGFNETQLPEIIKTAFRTFRENIKEQIKMLSNSIVKIETLHYAPLYGKMLDSNQNASSITCPQSVINIYHNLGIPKIHDQYQIPNKGQRIVPNRVD